MYTHSVSRQYWHRARGPVHACTLTVSADSIFGIKARTLTVSADSIFGIKAHTLTVSADSIFGIKARTLTVSADSIFGMEAQRSCSSAVGFRLLGGGVLGTATKAGGGASGADM